MDDSQIRGVRFRKGQKFEKVFRDIRLERLEEVGKDRRVRRRFLRVPRVRQNARFRQGRVQMGGYGRRRKLHSRGFRRQKVFADFQKAAARVLRGELRGAVLEQRARRENIGDLLDTPARGAYARGGAEFFADDEFAVGIAARPPQRRPVPAARVHSRGGGIAHRAVRTGRGGASRNVVFKQHIRDARRLRKLLRFAGLFRHIRVRDFQARGRHEHIHDTAARRQVHGRASRRRGSGSL